MNVKKILSGICATVVCTSFFAVQPAAEARSAEEQEQRAYRLTIEDFGRIPTADDSEFSRKFTPIIQRIQKRICDANGIEITTQKYRNDDDYRTKIHPAIAVKSDYSCSVGAGYIYIADANVNNSTAGKTTVSDQYDYIGLEKVISHEIAHNILGHGIKKTSEYDGELQAEEKMVDLLDPLPEGGWGAFLAGVLRNSSYCEQQEEIVKSFEKATKGKIAINLFCDIKYKSSSGKSYPLEATFTEFYAKKENSFTCRDINDDYFGGQIAYCIAKGALTPGSLQVVDNHLKDEIKFNSGCLLICRSSKLPNG